MTDSPPAFAPDWASPPGDTIFDLAQERGWTQVELAERLGYTEKFVSHLVNGKVPLSVETAVRLELVLGPSLEFWLRREANYQHHQARIDAAARHAEWTSWLDELPLRELMAAGAIPRTRSTARHQPAQVEACLRFFGVASPQEWRRHYGAMQVSFRRSRQKRCDVGAISAWLRLGEREAERLDAGRYDKARFEQALGRIRQLSGSRPSVFAKPLLELLLESGVLLVLVPAIPRAQVSGVARWLNASRPLIQMSMLGRSNDRFWFTFFHEAAHILLHAASKQDRRSIFLDDPGAGPAGADAQELEADAWAADFLVPAEHASELAGLRTKAAVVDFAARIGVHPGIVVGRLQHDGLIAPSRMNDLKQSFDFDELVLGEHAHARSGRWDNPAP